MSLPVFRSAAAAEAVPGQVLTLGEDVAGHAVRVRRIGPGEVIDIVDGAGTRARGTVTTASATEVSIDVTAVTTEPAPAPRLVLVQALAKGDRDLQAIETATEIGVDDVIPWAAERSIADWPAKKREKMAAKWENLLHAASLQARRSHFPQLHELVRGASLARHLDDSDAVFVLHETAQTTLTAALRDLTTGELPDRIVFVVGPEGGISDSELTALQEHGAAPVLLGPTILRSSSAGSAGLVLAQNSLGRW
ncbi:16S rRNA (uracil(1498)-N(3))-methyltransferase [Brevibacterium spongiae]|uniref:Ribosomal RNA small subunit methyltransferase E n=1 Tax=Brevibacterium spongiae TaxID=2909672 RepID=A0ABY5SKQ5_9MICO|nr:16S rRNA (uracil(1498)-N(3))-methyltransferase [Brevibacterium spongiae]UVI34541.1 16S rRNA (uracil(1498)-N(3))-methyltransferase [Brevibacterium spongiae]